MGKFLFIDVALPVATFSTFTYKIDTEKHPEEDLIGRRVLVPFRSFGLTGIIVGISEKEPDFHVKEIFDFPDIEPVFTEDYVNILKSISDFYISPVGIFFHYAIPEGLRWVYNRKTGRWIKKTLEEKVYTVLISELNKIETLSKRGKELVKFILEKGEVTKEELKEEGFSESTLKTLIKKGVVEKKSYIFKEEISKNLKQPLFRKYPDLKKGFYLYDSDLQEKRLSKYIQIISNNTIKGKGSVVVFPNIKSADRFYAELKSIFGDKVFLYHDGIPNTEKVKNWFLLKKLKGCIVVGTYSSLFIPVKDLETIILEDEHSESYKSKRTPKFDARRLAYEICKKLDITLIFSSSVPSVESYYSVKRGFLKRLYKKNIFSNLKSPELKILNFSSVDDVKKIILKEIKKTEDILIIGNKRGYASFLYCDLCEQEVMCNRCDVPVKVYKEKERFFLKCDICGKKYMYIKNCLDCENPLREIGFGIEKIEEILKNSGIDYSYIEEEKQTDVKIAVSLSGKEFFTKSFSTVLNVYPDFYLNINDYRGEEKFFRNIFLPYTKAINRYILITNNKDLSSVKAIEKKNLSIFYDNELEVRKDFGYPPFVRYIYITFEKRDLTIKDVAKLFEEWLIEENISVDYEGPFYGQRSKIRGRNIIQIVLKNFKEKPVLKLLYEKVKRKNIKVSFEIF